VAISNGMQQQQHKTSALSKPDVDLFIARTDRHATDTTYQSTNQPASQSDSTQLKAGNLQPLLNTTKYRHDST